MAEKMTSTASLNHEDSFECAICLLPCMQPVQFPCSHVFCFLCAKGIAMQSRKCALCRSSIPQDFITKPSLFTKPGEHHQPSIISGDSHVWYYQGYNGWWQYDERTSAEIEAAYNRKAASVDVLVAGSVYVIDLENLIQYQRHRNSRKRKIKRDLITANKKGVAGLETECRGEAPQPSSGSDAPVSSIAGQSNVDESNADVVRAQLSESTQDSGRQLPVGADEQNSDNLALNNALTLPVTPNFVRTSSDAISNFSQHQVAPALRRYHTYPYSQSDPTLDDPME